MKIEYSKEVLERAMKAVEIGQAVLDGKEIEYRYRNDFRQWFGVHTPSLNFDEYNYRVKPEPKYVPFSFEDANDLMGKVIKKMDGTHVQKIVQLNRDYVFAGVGIMDYEWLLKYYTFLDGTPCGKKAQ